MRSEPREERRRAHEKHQIEFETKRNAWASRTRENIAQNKTKLSKAQDARDRTREHIRDLRNKLSESTTDKWITIHGEWLAEAQAKLNDIESNIERIEGWINEDERKLYS